MDTNGSRMSDSEKVAVIDKLAADVTAGAITGAEQIEAALAPLGSDVGPFGGASFEMDVALEKLRKAARAKGIDF